MRFPLLPLVRLVGFVGLSMFVAAVGLSRAVPKPTTFRMFEPPRYFGVSGVTFSPPSEGDFLLDATAGTLRPFEPVPGCRLDCASESPWRAEEGQREMIARVVPRDNQSSLEIGDCFGLTRIPLSGGVARAETTGPSIVSGRPCWLPGHAGRVVFPCGDGRLYVQDLVSDERESSGSPPRPVAWRAARPEVGPIVIMDVACPTFSAFGGRLLVSLSTGRDQSGKRVNSARIWWIELDAAGDAVVAAGPVFSEKLPADPLTIVHRWPSLAVAPDGRMLLTLLSRESHHDLWRLRCVPIVLDKSGTPVPADPGALHDLDGGFAAIAPVISPDSRWVYVVNRKPDAEGGLLRRFSITAMLDECDAAPARLLAARPR